MTNYLYCIQYAVFFRKRVQNIVDLKFYIQRKTYFIITNSLINNINYGIKCTRFVYNNNIFFLYLLQNEIKYKHLSI